MIIGLTILIMQKNLFQKLKLLKIQKEFLFVVLGLVWLLPQIEIKKIRAGLAFSSEIAKLMREHNDANVLVLPGKYMNIHEAIKCVENFLSTNFKSGRHQNRINKL